eukprot:scaffold8364_cov246-Skeletonema_marinoi.AAC.2
MHMHTCTTTRNGMQPRGPASHFHSILLITGQNGSMQRASFDFVRVPTNTTDESFEKCSSWIDKAIGLNSSGKDEDNKTTSAKRIAKKY